MQLADDITSDDLKIFLEEAEEQLQLLDDEVIQLEKEATEEGLATIFRAAHTLKGSSAMLGYTAMSRVAHAMESLLEKLRNGEVVVTPELVDALLHSLDALRILTDELIEERGVEVDFESLVAELDACAGTVPVQAATEGETAKVLELNDDALDMISAAFAAGEKVFGLTASVVGDEAFSSIRLFQLTIELTEQARLIVCSPTIEEIQAEQNGMTFKAIVRLVVMNTVPSGSPLALTPGSLSTSDPSSTSVRLMPNSRRSRRVVARSAHQSPSSTRMRPMRAASTRPDTHFFTSTCSSNP